MCAWKPCVGHFLFIRRIKIESCGAHIHETKVFLIFGNIIWCDHEEKGRLQTCYSTDVTVLVILHVRIRSILKKILDLEFKSKSHHMIIKTIDWCPMTQIACVYVNIQRVYTACFNSYYKIIYLYLF